MFENLSNYESIKEQNEKFSICKMCQFDTTSLLTASKPLLTRYEEELRVLQSKSRMKDNVILKLNSDKVQLEQKVVDLEERLKKEAEKQVKAGKQCSKKIKNITVLLLFHT